MAKPHRMKQIEQERGENLESLIPRLLEELGTVEAVARQLNTSGKTIFRWLQRNGYERKVEVTWVRRHGAAHHPRKRLSV